MVQECLQNIVKYSLFLSSRYHKHENAFRIHRFWREIQRTYLWKYVRFTTRSADRPISTTGPIPTTRLISSPIPTLKWAIFVHYGLSGGNMDTQPLGPRRNRWAACTSRRSFLFTDRPSDFWLTVSCLSLPRKGVLVKPSVYISLIALIGWLFMKHILSVMAS